MTATETVSDSDRQAEAGEWLDTRAAMLRLGISERTLHRRLGRGELRKRGRPGGRIEVWAPLPAGRSATEPNADIDRQAEQAERALALVERVNLAVSEQVAPLLAMVERQQSTIRDQAEELGKLRQQVTDLERRLTGTDPLTVGDGQGGSPPEPMTRRPWWRFWRA
jgi:chromosome segregation ATPase